MSDERTREARRQVQALMEAVENYVEAKMDLARASRAYTGPSPGWALQREHDRLDHMTDALAIALHDWKVAP